MKKIHPVIMAGGSGTRFWPGSRKNFPKQLLSLATNRPLLVETISRVLPIASPTNIHIVTGKNIEGAVTETTKDYGTINIIAEPKGRNTAPCIGYMAFWIAHFSNPDDVMIVLPSDHLIGNKDNYLETLKAAVDLSIEQNTVVTLGIKPTSAHTGYGYIEKGKEVDTACICKANSVMSFKEKPNKKDAEVFFKSGKYLWNAGMFIVKASVMIDAIKTHMPILYDGLIEIASAFGTENQETIFTEKFPMLPAESIDCGVLEKLDKIITIPSDFGWNDIGSWTSLEDFKVSKDFGIANTDKIQSLDSKNLIINSNNPKKLIATLGVDDLVIIDTDDVLLVASKKEAQRIKELVGSLEDNGLGEYL